MRHTALITGASFGIGYELAKLFAKDNYNLVLVARNAERLQKIVTEFQQQYNITVHIFSVDLSLPKAVEKIFQFTQEKNISVDFLINNAGFGTHGMFAESNLDEQLGMIQVNITALTHLTKLFLPEMMKRNFGKIMNVASTAAFQPGPFMATYYATKAYVLSFSEALASELKTTNITVTALCPGPTETEFQKRAKVEQTKLFAKSGMVMQAETVANIGYKGLMKGKTLIIPGMWNKLLVHSVRFFPRKLVIKIVRKLQEERNNGL